MLGQVLPDVRNLARLASDARPFFAETACSAKDVIIKARSCCSALPCAKGVSGCAWGRGSTTDRADCVIADLRAHLLSHARPSQSALRASAQVGDPASEVRFIVEGHARMEATFINLPDTHRAIEFPIMLLTNGLEWCDACLIRRAGPAGGDIARMQIAASPGMSTVFLGSRLLHKVLTFWHRAVHCRLHALCLSSASMELPVGQS